MLSEAFFKQFPDEQSCKDHLKQACERSGLVCKECGSINHFWLANEEKWQCYECKSRTNLTAGTLMHRSKLSLYTWYKCIHYMSASKIITTSALQMMRYLDLTTHKSVWNMMHKIRIVMGKRDAAYKLQGDMEIDDAFFDVVMYTTTVDSLGNRYKIDKNGERYVIPIQKKRGRGSESKRAVMVMVESPPTKNTNPNKKSRQMGFVKMVAMDNLQQAGIECEIIKAVDIDSDVISDDHPCYSGLKKLVSRHTPMIVPSKDAMKKLPWVHTTIANAKRKILGVYYSVNDKYFQNYLNEFVYKLNRSDFKRDAFEGLFKVGLSGRWDE